MASKKSLERAAKLYKSFRGTAPKNGQVLRMALPKSLASIGYVRIIGYDTTLDGKTELYQHEFAGGSAPLLCVDPASGQLHLVGGRYRFSAKGEWQGIIDLDGRGRDIRD